MRSIFLMAIAAGSVAIAACATTRSDRAPANGATVHTTGAETDTVVGGEGYSGTTEYGRTYGPHGESFQGNVDPRARDGGVGNREPDQNGGDIQRDSIAR